jgi:Homeodomain-like domain
MSVVLMSKRELNRIDILARLESGCLTPGAAAALLQVSERQVYRLRRRFQGGGPAGIADRRRGRPSNNRLPDALRDQAIALVREHYADFGPTLAAEKLEDRHDLRVSRETLRSWMIQAGVWRPRAERKRFHQPRHRREHVGELIQIDGCEHRWFEDRGPPCTLLVFVDDATSRLMALGFVPSESTFAYFEVLRRYLEAHGKPVAFYSDKHSIFRVSKEDAAAGDGMTQFGRALADLNIEILCANSSQAKGRVERAHATLQDRLVKELRLAGISDLEAANAFLPGFVESYNSKFARAPARDLDLHRPLDGMNQLGDILCWRETRRVSQQLVVHYNQMKFTLHPTEITARLVGQAVEIYDFPDGRLEIRWKGLPLAYAVFDKLQRVSHAAIVENKRLGEVLAWIKERQDARPVPSGDRVGPRRSSQKSGLMKDRADRLARIAPSRPKLDRLGRRRSDREVCAPPPQAPSHPA